MKPKAKDATAEQLIADLVYYEDPDAILQITHDGKGTILIADQVWRHVGEGATIKDALIDFGRHCCRIYSEYSDFDYDYE